MVLRPCRKCEKYFLGKEIETHKCKMRKVKNLEELYKIKPMLTDIEIYVESNSTIYKYEIVSKWNIKESK